MNAKVYIVDPDEQHRDRVAKIAETLGLEAQGFDSGEQLLEAVTDDATGCVVAELRTRGTSGLELLDQLAKRSSCLSTIIITHHAKTATTVDAMQRGALTVLDKPAEEDDIWNALRRALIVSDKLKRDRDAQIELANRFESLTPVESRVASLIVEGSTNRQIAESDRVSVRTIEARRQKVYRKLGVKSLQALVEKTIHHRENNHSHPFAKPHLSISPDTKRLG